MNNRLVPLIERMRLRKRAKARVRQCSAKLRLRRPIKEYLSDSTHSTP